MTKISRGVGKMVKFYASEDFVVFWFFLNSLESFNAIAHFKLIIKKSLFLAIAFNLTIGSVFNSANLELIKNILEINWY